LKSANNTDQINSLMHYVD